MRLWVCVCACAAVIALVECQGSTNTNTRIGLVSTDLNVPPVPGGFPGPTVRPSPQRRCVCVPTNQVCSPGPLPDVGGDQGDGTHHGEGIINVRIVNRPTGGKCPGQKLCCIEVPGHGPGPTQRPSPVVPIPVPVRGGCGVRDPALATTTRAEFGEYPWMAVVLTPNNDYRGGGVLISQDWVLTAAHKVADDRSLKVRLGDLDVSKRNEHPTLTNVEVQVERIIIHPNLNRRSLLNDVALLKLSQPIPLGRYPHIGTACLPEQGQIFGGNERCWVTGWGKDAFDSSGSFQAVLKEVDVPMVDPFVCEERLKNTELGHSFRLDKNSFVCAGGEFGKDACSGDGGSPLVCQRGNRWVVVGLVAWGIECGTQGVPGVYVNVPSFVNYIRQYVRV